MSGSIYNRRPQGYEEWRILLHEIWRGIGMSVAWRMARRARRADQLRGVPVHPVLDRIYGPVLTRDVWKRVSQAERIMQHMDAEAEAGTESAMRAILEARQTMDDDDEA